MIKRTVINDCHRHVTITTGYRPSVSLPSLMGDEVCKGASLRIYLTVCVVF